MSTQMLPRTHEHYDSAATGSPAWRELTELVRYRDLVRQLAARNIKVRYKRSVLGVAWSLLNPLLTTGVLAIVFSSVFQAATPHYVLYLLPGLLIWNFFAQTTSTMAAEVIGGADLWRRIYTPRTVFAAATVVTGLVHLGLALVPLGALMLVFRPPLGLAWLTMPLAVVAVTAFALGVGLTMSALAHRFSDVVDMYQILLMAWMYMTPVIYPRSIVPARYQWMFAINPMAYFVDWFRGPLGAETLPTGPALASGLGLAFATLAAGWWLFTRTLEGPAGHE